VTLIGIRVRRWEDMTQVAVTRLTSDLEVCALRDAVHIISKVLAEVRPSGVGDHLVTGRIQRRATPSTLVDSFRSVLDIFSLVGRLSAASYNMPLHGRQLGIVPFRHVRRIPQGS